MGSTIPATDISYDATMARMIAGTSGWALGQGGRRLQGSSSNPETILGHIERTQQELSTSEEATIEGTAGYSTVLATLDAAYAADKLAVDGIYAAAAKHESQKARLAQRCPADDANCDKGLTKGHRDVGAGNGTFLFGTALLVACLRDGSIGCEAECERVGSAWYEADPNTYRVSAVYTRFAFRDVGDLKSRGCRRLKWGNEEKRSHMRRHEV